MAGRNFQNVINHSEPGMVIITGKITAAADVAANGYTVTEGSDFISTATRTGEGVMRITMKNKYKRVLFPGCISDEDDKNITFVGEDVDGSTPYIDFEFRTVAASPAAADPDSGVIYLFLVLKNSGVD